MSKFFWRFVFFVATFLYSIYGSSQPSKSNDCNTTCFSSKVLSVKDLSPGCRKYEVEVSFSGKCAHALSHYSVAVPCGEVKDISNSQNWRQVIGRDPATGLTGFKIDDITGFGESSVTSFIVTFTVCSSNEDCLKDLKCWQPLVAYKASTCVNFETVQVECKTLKASLTHENVTCYGAADGSIAVVIEDGQEPYSYLWSNNSAGQSIEGLAAGKYSVIVKDGAGSQLTLEETISQPAPLIINGVVTDATCNGMADGSINVSISGGKVPYTFVWNNGATSQSLAGVGSGQYIVTVQDAAGCNSTARFSVANSTVITLTASLVKPDCNTTNGSIDLSVTGGKEPYTFQWSNGVVTEDINNAQAGLYMVVVADAAGCTAQKTVLLRENNTLSLRGTPTAASCTGDPTGSVDLSVSGGTAPYMFTWSNGQTTEDLSAVASGTYSVKVVDANGCVATATFSVTKSSFHVPRTVVQPTCYGSQDGSITLHEPIGGTAPYTYEWSNGETGTSLSGLPSGSYSVVVTDAAGCTRSFSITVSSPAELTASFSVSSATCEDESSYGIDLTASGGTGDYTYQWSNGSADEDIQGIPPGRYTVIITDANGCSVTKETIVEQIGRAVSCVIHATETMPVCGTGENTLSSSVADADSYSWTMVSSDGSWSLTSAATGAAITYSAGNANTFATFMLSLTKNGCSTTCSYVVSACMPSDNIGGQPGGGEPGGEEPGQEIPGEGKQSCDECFATTAALLSSSGGCKTYEVKVSTDGLCQHDLSHWVFSLPCGTVSDVWNSAGWPMQIGKDPVTGLYGLKVDDINGFGSDEQHFTVRFTLCEITCDLAQWHPLVAYKAGQCVATENIAVDAPLTMSASPNVYPNPFSATVRFEWRANGQQLALDIIDQYGNVVIHSAEPVEKTDTFYFDIDGSPLPNGMYYYRLTVDGRTYNGKISKR